MANKFMKKSGNPFMKEEAYRSASNEVLDRDMVQRGAAERMTVSGAVNKSFILMGIMLATSIIGYSMPALLWPGAIVGLILVVVASFKQHLSPYLAPAYAAFEGLFVGAITMMYASAYNGIIIQAVTLTIAILFMMLFIYKTGIIKVTEKFRMGVMMATGAVFIVYMASWILGMFGVNIPFLHEGGMMGIGISVVIIGIASFNLLLDFDNFEKGEKFGAPAYMEWFSAMGLLITLVWLYVEILRLLAILSSSD